MTTIERARPAHIASLEVGDDVSLQMDVPVRMRDGTILRANVYRPRASSALPVLLCRTPYDKNDNAKHVWSGLDPVLAARRGFIVVIQDVRGRFGSDGHWSPYAHEGNDGFDTIEWAAALPGSNGAVGMYSASYCANAQWQAAMQRPPALGALSPAMTWSDPEDGLLSRGGAVELGLALRWSYENGVDTIRRNSASDEEHEARVDAMLDDWDRVDTEGYWDLPVSAGMLLRHRLPDLGILTALSDPGVAKAAGVPDIGSLTLPTLHTGGWYDIFIQGTLDNYVAMAAAGRRAQLVVGPWTHQTFADPIGDLRFGARSSRAADGSDTNWQNFQMEWFHGHLTGSEQPIDDEAPVRLFVMGTNRWRAERRWPLERQTSQRLFFQAGGSMSEVLAAEESYTEYEYDPSAPVPTLGGHGVMSPATVTGPIDQRTIEARDDVLIFTSAPLNHDVEVTGRVFVWLYAQSSAPSADWVARLCDVHEDGRSINLCDGILRAPGSADHPALHKVDLWSTSNVFLRGHRIRIQITSSSFPRWDRNLGTGDQSRPEFVTTVQRIFHGGPRASYVELPIIPSDP
jgi:putative CocE/NonD family hydrolase